MNIRKRSQQFMLLVLVTPASLALAENSAGSWKIATGFDVSEGDYGGGPDTEIFYLPVSIAYSDGPWSVKVTLPWLEIKGPGNVVGGGEGGVIIGRGGQSGQGERVRTESGIGDIWLAGTYSVESVDPNLFYLDLTGKVKLPTADEDKGLGTGEMDYTLQADIYKSAGQWTPMATLAYKIKGDPDGIALDNVLYLSAGADYRLDDQRNLGGSLDYQQASTSAADDALELFLYMGQRLSAQWSGSIYTYLGLTDGSPDYGVGMQAGYRF